MSTLARICQHAALLLFTIFLAGTALHEGGHALAAALAGAPITEVVVLGLRVWPTAGFVPTGGLYGWVRWEGDLGVQAQAWVRLAGSAATWGASMIALLCWRARGAQVQARWRARRTVHLAMCVLWVDVFCHSLPRVGIPMYLLFGSSEDTRRVSELIYGGLELGLPEVPLLLAIGLMPLLTLWRLRPWRCRAVVGVSPSSLPQGK